MNVLLRMATFGLRAATGENRLSCLIYHRVLPVKDPLFPEQVTAEQFDWQVQMLAAEFNLIPLSQAVDCLAQGTLPPRAACITFDDGYADNHDIALPILLKHRVTACFFVATGYLDGGCMWNDVVIDATRNAAPDVLDLESIGLGRHGVRNDHERRAAIESLLTQLKYRPLAERTRTAETIRELAGTAPRTDLMMGQNQVAALAQSGMEIGAHTVRHPILTQLPADEARKEIRDSKNHLEAILGKRVDLFAYPNGRPGEDYSREHIEMTRAAGFKAAVSTARGVSGSHADPYQVPRFTPWDRTPSRFMLRLIQNGMQSAYRKV